jgi:hypothetical protein
VFNLEIKRSGLLSPPSSHIQGIIERSISKSRGLGFYYLLQVIFRGLSSIRLEIKRSGPYYPSADKGLSVNQLWTHRMFDWKSRDLDGRLSMKPAIARSSVRLKIKRSGLLLPVSSHIQGIIDETESVHLSSSRPISRVTVIVHCTTETYIKKARYSFQMCLLTFTKTKLPDNVSSLFQLCQHTLRIVLVTFRLQWQAQS